MLCSRFFAETVPDKVCPLSSASVFLICIMASWLCSKEGVIKRNQVTQGTFLYLIYRAPTVGQALSRTLCVQRHKLPGSWELTFHCGDGQQITPHR